MWAAYLVQALANLTAGLDGWGAAKVVCEDLLAKPVSDWQPLEWMGSVAAMTTLFASRVGFFRIREALASSKSMRTYFKNMATRDKPATDLQAQWPRNLSALVPKHAKLLSLLSAMMEEESINKISAFGPYWVGELRDILNDAPGGRWQTDFTTQMVEESYDAITNCAIFRRLWHVHTDGRTPEVEGWDEYLQYAKRLVDPNHTDIIRVADIVKRHIVPPDRNIAYVGPISSPIL